MTVPDPNAFVTRASYDALAERVKYLEDTLLALMDGFKEEADQRPASLKACPRCKTVPFGGYCLCSYGTPGDF